MANTNPAIAALATIENANEWAATPEKWVFCSDLLESVNLRNTDAAVEELEDALEALLS